MACNSESTMKACTWAFPLVSFLTTILSFCVLVSCCSAYLAHQSVQAPLPVLALVSCAPTVTQTPTYIDLQGHRATCAVSLDEMARVAPVLRPASLGGATIWPPYVVARRTATTLTVTSTTAVSGVFGGLTPSVKSTSGLWTCTEVPGIAMLSVRSTGQREEFARASHVAFFGAINLPT